MGNQNGMFSLNIYEDFEDSVIRDARQNLRKNIITAKEGDTKDIIGAGGQGEMPMESARVGGYCEIDIAYYSTSDCSGAADYTTKQIGFYGIC